MSDNRGEKINYFFASPTRKEVFTKNTRKKTTRKETRKRLEELKLAFPMLPICISADSLYASETILKECKEKGWKYLLRFKEAFHQYMKSMKA